MNHATLQELFDALSSPLALYARQWCSSPDDAVQEAFFDLSNCGEMPQCPNAWLYTTTRRKAQNIARAEARRARHQQQFAEQRLSKNSTDHWFQKSAHATLAPEDVVQALEQLPPEQREILVARVWGELNFGELAVLMNCSASSAHRRYLAALERLKGIMQSDDSNIPNLTSAHSGDPVRSTANRDNLADGEPS